MSAIFAHTLDVWHECREAYASPELMEFWATTPRVTFAEFERQWMAVMPTF